MQISGLSASNTFSATDVLAIEVNVNGTNKTYKMTGATLATALASIGSYLTTADVVNDLTSTATDKPLSANMGKTLKDLIAQSSAIIDRMQGTGSTFTGVRCCGMFCPGVGIIIPSVSGRVMTITGVKAYSPTDYSWHDLTISEYASASNGIQRNIVCTGAVPGISSGMAVLVEVSGTVQ